MWRWSSPCSNVQHAFKTVQCPAATSPMLHRVLQPCPYLKQFAGAMIRDDDMFSKAISREADFQPWACLHLKTFQCYIEVQDKSRNRQVLQAIASLRQLETLKMGYCREQRTVDADGTKCFALKIKAGLAELGRLKGLIGCTKYGFTGFGLDRPRIWSV